MGNEMASTTMSGARTLQRALLWRRRDAPGAEHFLMWETAEGPQLEGTAVVALDGVPLCAHYNITCSPSWETRAVRVTLARGATVRALDIAVDDRYRWRLDGRHIDALDGCRDIDLGVTPSTNSLPIRRLALSVGEQREVTAAWIRFPELTLSPLPQCYTRTGERRYQYESRGGAFVAQLEVDDLGLVTRYGEFWERVAELRGG
jgi:hypothetical protein